MASLLNGTSVPQLHLSLETDKQIKNLQRSNKWSLSGKSISQIIINFLLKNDTFIFQNLLSLLMSLLICYILLQSNGQTMRNKNKTMFNSMSKKAGQFTYYFSSSSILTINVEATSSYN